MSAIIEKVNNDITDGKEEHDMPALIDVAIGSVINSVIFGYRFHEARSRPNDKCVDVYLLVPRERILRAEAASGGDDRVHWQMEDENPGRLSGTSPQSAAV